VSKVWNTLALLVLAVAIVVAALILHHGSDFAGADSVSTELVAESAPDYEPWFSPLWEHESGEVEAGMFALQAGLGAGIVGFALGTLRGRRERGSTVGAPTVSAASAGD
jgi:cobalt/nickel transport protein